MNDTAKHGFRIRRWDVYPQQNLLKRPGYTKTLEPKVMDLLVFLAERHGEVVSRQQILDAVWREVVVGDEVVSRAISLLRTELGDDRKTPRYLKTISKRGYCLIANVTLESSHEPQQGESISDAGGSATAESPREIIRRATSRSAVAIVAVLALALAYFAYEIFTSQPEADYDVGNIGQSIAVLPFVNMSPDSDNEYFSDGLSEQLLNQLSKIPELRVAARTSSFSYKAKDVNIAQIGEELNVTHVLEGSVRKTGNHVRITAQLIEVDNGFQLWSETFDRTLDDIFVVQDEIAKAVVDELSISLLSTMPEISKTDAEVFALYLQGNYFMNRGGEENLEKAFAALKQALAIDPDYAPAWVSLQLAYGFKMRAMPGARDEKIGALQSEAIERALDIDENLASAWAALAYQRRVYDSDWHGARIAIDKALQLEPNNAGVIAVAASIASTSGRLLDSIELFEKAASLDPLNLVILMSLGRRYLQVSRIDDAFDTFDRVRAINPDYPGLGLVSGRAYMMQGDLENALLETEKKPDEFYYRHQKANFLYMMGKEAEAQVFISELLETSADEAPGAMATVYAWRGESDSAFEWLERAHEQHDARPSAFLGNIWWRKLTGDPRYSAFVENIGLLEEWKAMPPEYGGPPGHRL